MQWQEVKWPETGITHYVLINPRQKFYISYNPNIFGSGLDETALVDGAQDCQDNTYYILKGDWRKEYEKAFPHGWYVCYRIFEVNYDEFGHVSSARPIDWKQQLKER